jgi:hypothetical protein
MNVQGGEAWRAAVTSLQARVKVFRRVTVGCARCGVLIGHATHTHAQTFQVFNAPSLQEEAAYFSFEAQVSTSRRYIRSLPAACVNVCCAVGRHR